ncbi:MAG: helix-turn-helix domain-containing protein [Hydrogenophaga sp.]|uniref:AraC family transcriptional regulator n=1 Tax=Hydrogenophaga sp. TaxID=1904254 RepID=UPI001DC346D2|nr:AraC family transcriptional regulator [Hydrogenophaga sp.]MBX3608256.1 helix-turn-helix domain-containing protein [Hydrogenophaga sp.]
MGTSGHDHIGVRAYGASPGSHAHDHFQILIGLEGVLELEVAGHGQRIGPGIGCVVRPGDRHDFESSLGARCLVLDSHDEGWARAPGTPSSATVALASYLAEACERALPRAQTLGPALLLESWLPAASAVIPATRPRRAIDWIALSTWARARWSTAPLAVADLAAQTHLSPAQFAARCRQELGQSTQQWLRNLQLDHAQALRRQGSSVAEAARLSGYRSPSALTAALRRRGR